MQWPADGPDWQQISDGTAKAVETRMIDAILHIARPQGSVPIVTNAGLLSQSDHVLAYF